MAKELPKPLAETQARIEAERAPAEIWFNEQIQKNSTRDAFDRILLEYVHYVFFAYADELFNAGLS